MHLYNGLEIPDSKYPAVVRLGGCTGTFVSDSTMVYAAHCLKNNGNTETVRSPIRATTSNTFLNPRFLEIGSHDVAVAIFPAGTSKNWIPLYQGRREPGTKIHMIGWGCNSQNAGGGIKREGYNTIERANDGVIRSSSSSANWTDRGSDVAVCPGDSGGPLLIDGRLAGVTSFHTFGTGSGHPDLQFSSNQEFLRSMAAKGAKIYGLDGLNDPNEVGIPPPLAGIYAHIGKPYDANGSAIQLHAATTSDAAQVVFCLNIAKIADCSLTSPTAVPGVFVRTASGQRIYKFDRPLELRDADNYFIAGFDKDGRLNSGLQFKVR